MVVVPSMKGALGRNAIGWMKNYFKLNCEVMPTTGRLHLSDNYTRREVYDAYKSEMYTSSAKYVTYSQFTRLWVQQDLLLLLYLEQYTWEPQDHG